MKPKPTNGGLVYSTEGGRMCPRCRQPATGCRCTSSMPRPSADGVVRVSTQTKGRAGKGVTLVRGLALDEAAIATLGQQIRTVCGAGGTVKDGVIEVQGDQVERVTAFLKKKGFVVKSAG